MDHVAVNTKYVTISPKVNYGKIGEKGTFYVISTMTDLSIDQDTSLVIVEENKSDFTFTKKGVISSKGEIIPFIGSSKKSSSQNISSYKHLFDYEIEGFLTKNNKLSDLEYSLKSVYRYNSPEVHFHAQIRKLETEDYDTITNGWIYTIRTLFGKLVNALPRQNKLEFMLQCMDRFRTIDFKEVSLFQGYEFLNSYIERRIHSKGRLLVEIDEMLRTNLGNILPQNEIGFINTDNQVGNNISIQANMFKDLFTADLKLKSTNEQLRRYQLAKDTVEKRFEKIFESESWPIDLRA